MQSAYNYMKRYILVEANRDENEDDIKGIDGIRVSPKLTDLPSDLLSRVNKVKMPTRRNWAYTTKIANGRWDTKAHVTLKDAVLKCLYSCKMGIECRIGTYAQYRVHKREVPPDYLNSPEIQEMVVLADDLNAFFEQLYKEYSSLGVIQKDN